MAAVLVSLALVFVPLEPFASLFVASIAGGIGTPVSLGILLVTARDHEVMGSQRISKRTAVAGWATVALTSAATAAFFIAMVARSLHRRF